MSFWEASIVKCGQIKIIWCETLSSKVLQKHVILAAALDRCCQTKMFWSETFSGKLSQNACHFRKHAWIDVVE